MNNQLAIPKRPVVGARQSHRDSTLACIATGVSIYYLGIIVLSMLFGAVGAWVALGFSIAVGLFLILWKIEYFLGAYVVFLFTFRYVVYYFNLPVQFELVPVFLSFASVASLIFTRRSLRTGSGNLILIVYGIFFLPWILGAAFTENSLAHMGISFAWRFHGLFLFATAYVHPRVTPDWMRRYIILGAIILAAQFPVQILQWFNIPGQLLPPNETYVSDGLAANADFFSGTFGFLGGDTLGILELGAIYIMLCYGLIKGFSTKLIGLIILFFVPTIIGDITFARLGVLAFPLVAVLLWSLGKVTDFARIARAAMVMMLIVVPTVLLLLTLGEYYAPSMSAGGSFIQVSNLLDPDAWAANLSREYTNENYIYGRQSGRGTALLEAVDETAHADRPQFLVGYGPDSLRVTGSTLFGSTPSRLPTKNILYSFYGFDRLLLETGIVGTLLFMVVLIYPFIRVLLFTRKLPLGNLKMWGIMYLAVWFIFLATGQYDGGWFEPYQKVTVFWLLTAGILTVIDLTRQPRFASGHPDQIVQENQAS